MQMFYTAGVLVLSELAREPGRARHDGRQEEKDYSTTARSNYLDRSAEPLDLRH